MLAQQPFERRDVAGDDRRRPQLRRPRPESRAGERLDVLRERRPARETRAPARSRTARRPARSVESPSRARQLRSRELRRPDPRWASISGLVAAAARHRAEARRALRSIAAPRRRMAAGSPDLHDFTRSLASFLYCSRFGRDGRGSASCGLGYIRISFHDAPGVRTVRLKEGSCRSERGGWARPFPRTGCAPRALPVYDNPRSPDGSSRQGVGG